VLVVTDSQYVKNFIGLAPEWKRRGWCNRDGQPILNSDLWDELLKARAKAGIRVDFVWVEGKTSEIANRVDKLSKVAAKRGGFDKDFGYKPGVVRRSKVKGGKTLQFPANGQEIVIWPYVKKPIGKNVERVSFNVFREATSTFESKYYAFATSSMSFELHSWRCWRVKFNFEPKHPQILTLIEEVIAPPQLSISNGPL
jgi:hypothetical protein